jgi:hypothetical protein
MLQRSPVNFWLLLAATICVDQVLMIATFAEAQRRAAWLLVALVFGQLSALCVWALFSTSQQLPRLIAPFAFAIAAALWMGLARPRSVPDISFEQMVLVYCGLWLTHAAGFMFLLWAVRRTTCGRRWSYPVDASVWQFSMKHLLIVTTTIAVLIFILRSADLIHEAWLWVAILIVNHGGVALACLLLQATQWHVVARLAATAAVALLFGALLQVITDWPEPVGVNLIHAIVLFLWLEVGGIMPARGQAKAIAAQGTSQ